MCLSDRHKSGHHGHLGIMVKNFSKEARYAHLTCLLYIKWGAHEYGVEREGRGEHCAFDFESYSLAEVTMN